MKQLQRTSGTPTQKRPPPTSGGGGGRGNQAAAEKLPKTGGHGVADDEVGAWLAGSDGVLGSEGPHAGGSYVIQGGESLRELCEQAYGTPSASGDAFQVLVAVASGVMSPQEAQAIRDGSGVVGPIAKYGETWGLAPGTRLFFPRNPAQHIRDLAPDHLGWEQAGQIEEDIAGHEAVTAIEDQALAGAKPLMAAYDAFALHFRDVAPREKRSHSQFVKFEVEAGKALVSGAAKFEAAVTVTREADGTWSAERTLSGSLVILIGKHFDESLKTTGARSLAEVLAQLDLADALIAARAAGHDLDAEVLGETWGSRFGADAAIEHRKTAETLDIGLAYSDGDVKFGGTVSGETARKTTVKAGDDGAPRLGTSLEYASKFEASAKVKDEFELKGTLDGKREGAEENPTTVKAGVEATLEPLGVSLGFEQELTGEGASSRTMKIDLKKIYGEENLGRYLSCSANQRLALGTPVVDAACAALTALGVDLADKSFLRSAIAQAPGLTSIKLKASSDGAVTLTLVSDPGAFSVPKLKLKYGEGERTEAEYELAPARKVAPPRG